MKRIIAFLIPAGLAMLSGCAEPAGQRTVTPAPASSDAAPMAAADVQALYGTPHREEGVVLEGAHVGAHWSKRINADGTVELTAAHGMFTDTGTLTVRGNEVCYTWTHIDAGRETCVHLVKIGPDEYVSYGADGSRGSRFRVVNP